MDPVTDAKILTESPPSQAPQRPTWALMRSHPLHWVSFGFGSGLSPVAPGTVGTLWAWASFLLLDRWLDAGQWAVLLALGLPLGWWACTRTAQSLRISDPGSIVWDEVIAFWWILYLIMPTSWGHQLAAFALFRFFDALKPGPVAWADGLFKPAPGSPPGWAQGFGILLDDLVAALCTLLCLALWQFLQIWQRGGL